MNKLLKGSVAGAAGLTLLLGGAGTFAFWNDSVALDAAVVTAGTLTVTPSEALGTWSASVGDETFDDIDLATYRIVPGATLTYTREVNVVASGAGLTAELALTPGSISAADAENAADVALALELAKSAEITVVGAPGIVVDATDSSIAEVTTVGAADGDNAKVDADITVSVTLEFPNTAVSQNAAKNGVVDLSAIAVSLTQAAPTAPAE